MATKLRREKDIISRVTEDYQTATTTLYQRYLEGSPCYVTYYQFYAPGSTTDNSLEAVHSMTNTNSPNVYKVIEDFPLYGLEQLDIENSLTERGLESMINATLVVIPQTIIPTTSDFICFQVPGMERELFQITNVTFDRVHANRYYQITIDLYRENVDEIFENCIDTRYVYDEDDNNGTDVGTGAEDGSIGGSIIPVDQKELKDNAENLYDSVLDQYQKLFYDSDLDQFVYRGYGKDGKAIAYWSPYLQKFLFETKLMRRYNAEVMTEFYVRDIDSWTYGEKCFNDYCWDHCIYKSILTESSITEEQCYVAISGYDLRDFKMVPFFWSPNTYKMIDFDLGPKTFWMNAFHITKDPILDEPIEFVVDGMAHGFVSDPNFNANNIPVETIVYEDKLLPPKASYKIIEMDGVHVAEKVVWPDDGAMIGDVMVKYLKQISEGTFKLDTESIKALNTYHYKKSLQLYLILPIILYGIKQKIDSLAKE